MVSKINIRKRKGDENKEGKR